MMYKEIDENLEYGKELRKIIERFKDGMGEELDEEDTEILVNILRLQILRMEDVIDDEQYSKGLDDNYVTYDVVKELGSINYCSDYGDDIRSYYKYKGIMFRAKYVNENVVDDIKNYFEKNIKDSADVKAGEIINCIINVSDVSNDRLNYSLYELAYFVFGYIKKDIPKALKSAFVNINGEDTCASILCENYNSESMVTDKNYAEIVKFVDKNRSRILKYFKITDIFMERLSYE